MSKIENHKYTIEDAFKNCFYVVPDYQREYVWKEKEICKLLEDINDEIGGESTSEYFIGTILVSPTKIKDHIDIIDGQQRLTTLFLMLCVLRTLFKGEPQENILTTLIKTSYTNSDGEIDESLKLDTKYDNAEEIVKKIVEANSNPVDVRNAIKTLGIKQFGSLENLINAYDIIYNFLKSNYHDVADKTALKKYWGYLSNNVVFIQIQTDVSSALKIFETINERGIGLNPMDLLKNLLFYHVKPDDFTKLKNEWKKITSPLEEKNEKPLRFLRYFLMANYKVDNARKDGIIREDEIYEWFTEKNNALLCNYKNKPFEFVRKIIKNVESFMSLLDGRGNDNNDNIYMNNIKLLCGGAFSQHYVLLLAGYNLPKDLFDHLLKQLETFLFYYIITRTPTKELERSFSAWADELRNIGECTDCNKQKDAINIFIEDKFKRNTANKQPEFEDALRRYTFKSLQQYRTRYILGKLTQYVDMAYKGMLFPDSLSNYIWLEIEHILPNTPNAELINDFKASSPDKDYELYKIKLGNLTLLEKPINIVAGRSFYTDKCELYKKSGHYLTRSLAELNVVGQNTSINRINAYLMSFNVWDFNSIDTRQDMLIKLIAEVWKIEPMN